MNNHMYHLNNPLIPKAFSLIVLSINYTTTFQCIVESTRSTQGIVTMVGMYTITNNIIFIA